MKIYLKLSKLRKFNGIKYYPKAIIKDYYFPILYWKRTYDIFDKYLYSRDYDIFNKKQYNSFTRLCY